MRDIAYVLPEYPVASQTFVHAEIAALRAAGQEVDVLANRAGAVNIHFGPDESGRPVPAAYVGLDRAGVVDVLRGYRHVHTHFADFGLRVVAPLAARANRPWSVTVHADDLFRRDAAVTSEEWRALDARCQKVVAISRFHAAFVRSQGVPAERVVVIPNAVRLVDLLAEAPAPPTRLRTVLAVGRPVVRKGFPVLVQAWARARAAVPDLTLEIIGGAGLVADPPAGLVLSAMRPYADVLAAMAAADLFVAPSIVGPDGDMDGIPTVLAEAAALRRPVVASSLSGIGDLVCDGVNGLLVPAGDVDGLTRALLRLALRPDELQRLGAGGPMLAAAHDARRVAARLDAEVFAA